MAPFTLAHLSDPHLPPMPKPSRFELVGKRALGYLNWTRTRQLYHRSDILKVLVSDLRAQVPNHIAVTGDIVNLALEAEFRPARAWLETVGPPDQVTVIPGNHDAYVRATRHRFAESFAPYIVGDETDAPIFPALRRRGPLALISLSSAVPTLPLMATGTLGKSQLAALEQLLTELASSAVFRVLLVHHPLRSAARFKRLTDGGDLIALMKRHGVELVLHGHDHVHSTIWIDGPSRPIPVIGVPSASAAAHGQTAWAAYNLFKITRDGSQWRCNQTVRGVNDSLRMREIRDIKLF